MPNQRPPLFPVFRALAVAVGALALGCALLYSPRKAQPFHPPEPNVWATDIDPASPPWLQVGLKAQGPLSGQKRPPCTPIREREAVGACWIGTEHRPPCPDGIYEIQGRCMVPVLAAQRPLTSLHE